MYENCGLQIATFDLQVASLYPRCRLRGPKNGNGQKVVRVFVGPSQMTCPKSAQKVSNKLSKNGLSKIWGQKKAKNVVKKLSKKLFVGKSKWRPSVATQKRARRPSAAAPPFGSLFAKTRISDHFLTTLFAFCLIPDLAEAIFDSFFETF